MKFTARAILRVANELCFVMDVKVTLEGIDGIRMNEFHDDDIRRKSFS